MQLNNKIYLAGAMYGLSMYEQTHWREKIKELLKNSDFNIFDPTEKYSYFEKQYKSEKEIMQYELWLLKQCKVVVVNLAKLETSVGTLCELATAYENNIPIIGYGNEANSHPWIKEMLWRTETELEDIVELLLFYYQD